MNKEVAIVIDLDNDINSPSVTNAIEDIANELNISRILYQGSDQTWFYWNNQYVPIIENKKPVINDEKKAIKILTNLFQSQKVD